MPEVKYVLTESDVRQAIYADDDFSPAMVQHYRAIATSFLFQKTGYNWENEDPIEPLAKQCAILYVRSQHFGSQSFNKEHDYNFGLVAHLTDLQTMADQKTDTENPVS